MTIRERVREARLLLQCWRVGYERHKNQHLDTALVVRVGQGMMHGDAGCRSFITIGVRRDVVMLHDNFVTIM